ncbi:hypothetical protein ACWKT5_02160 [Streptomyces avermitilis]
MNVHVRSVDAPEASSLPRRGDDSSRPVRLTGGSDHDAVGNLRLIARTTPLPTAVRHDLAQQRRAAEPDHP